MAAETENFGARIFVCDKARGFTLGCMSQSKQIYESAKQCFTENRDALKASVEDREAWNLNVGLLALSSAIEQDLSEIKDLLSKILQATQKRP